MKAQLTVAGGDGDLPSIPGLTEAITGDHYAVDWGKNAWAILVFSIIVGWALTYVLNRLWSWRN